MNKENAHLFLPLVKALAEGKTIQYCRNNRWEDCNSILASNLNPYCYRIRPEPRVRWAVYLNGAYVSTWSSEESAQRVCERSSADNSYELVKFVEELDA